MQFRNAHYVENIPEKDIINKEQNICMNETVQEAYTQEERQIFSHF